MKSFDIQYLRGDPVTEISPAPANSCTWVETLGNIQRHFDPSAPNINFHFVVDQTGVTVYAQWVAEAEGMDKSTFAVIQLPAIMNTMRELACLYPTPDRLVFFVVDYDGKILIGGVLPDPSRDPHDTEFMDDIEIFYDDL